MKRLPVTYEQQFCYDIVLDTDSSHLPQELNSFDLKNHKICIVSDSNVAVAHIERVTKLLSNTAKMVTAFVFDAGEEQKNLRTVNQLYEFLIQQQFDRKDVLLALGGGVTGDLTGFTASTYLRGIRFFQAPTSLLAMVDSSIGGKTGVDFESYKNMVGAFYMPSGVYMDLSVLRTLHDREYLSGMGEIIKHGLIKDAGYYEWLNNNVDAIRNKSMDELMTMIARSCEIKREVVERDPKELGERAILNYGHSIGHAVEKIKDFTMLHGECVAVGMVAASYISNLRGYLTIDELHGIEQTLSAFSLPVSAGSLDYNQVLAVMSKDKKVEAGQIKFILLRNIGEAYIDQTVTTEEIKKAVEYISIER